MSPAQGGFLFVRHNEVRDFTAGLLHEVCNDIEVEPTLQPLIVEQLALSMANRDPSAQLDIKARGIWGGQFKCTFFDVQTFNPHARSNQFPQIYLCVSSPRERQASPVRAASLRG